MISEWVGDRALVVGCGSIGRRHGKNLRTLGLRNLAFCDTNPEALQRCAESRPAELFSNYEEALQKFRPDMVLICTPPVYHVDVALAALRASARLYREACVARIGRDSGADRGGAAA